MISSTEAQIPVDGVNSFNAEYASNLIKKPCFHQSITYSSPIDGRSLEVSFSTTSNFESASDMPTVLYLGPLLCSRYFLCKLDSLACLKGVRVIFIERYWFGESDETNSSPGFGSSTTVPLEYRVAHVLCSIPSVLSHLQVRYVALLSASAGTLYSLNALVTPAIRQFLHPQRPYVAALVPWVHPQFSQSRLFSAAARLPESLIASFGTVAKVFGTKIIPSGAWSSGLIVSLVSASGDTAVEGDIDEHVNQYGINKRHFDQLEQLLMKEIWNEDTSGLGFETRLLLQKNLPISSWGAASSYPQFVDTLKVLELNRLQQDQTPSDDGAPVPAGDQTRSRLRFKTFFATTDMMIGETGRKFFDACFKDCIGLSDAVEYSSSIVKNSNHETVMDIRKDAIGIVFDDVKESWAMP